MLKAALMRFLLINPFYPISETPSPPLGIAFLAAALEAAGNAVKVLDFVVTPYTKDFLASEVADFSPDMVGATAVTMTFDTAIGVIGDVKQIDPKILTVMGGPHVSFCVPETLDAFPELDIIVLGEGEETVVELSAAVENETDWGAVAGIAFRKGDELVNTGFRELIADINQLPLPARHLLPLGRYRALGMAISMTTSRGCPFNCIFCVGRKMVGAKVRYRDPMAVVDEIEYLASLGFPQINLADDLFTASPKHCIAVCDEIMRRGLKVKWTSFARVDTVSEKVLAKMLEAGCHTVSFGVESGNAGILKTIRKGITTAQVIDAVEMCNAVGMAPHASFILGLPGETPETLKETIDFGEKLKSLGVSHGFHLLAPFPGTAVREENEAYGIRILTNDWSQYHANRAIVETADVSQKALDDSVADWEKAFGDWLDDIKVRMESGDATEDESWPLINLERTVLIYDLMMARGIEEKGEWSTKASPVSEEAALMDLSYHLEGTVKNSRQEIYDALAHTMAGGNLTYREAGGTIQWAWVEQL
jgi:anaerobic magnesium-protoporphyrin IX monomethyl ester cyclase